MQCKKPKAEDTSLTDTGGDGPGRRNSRERGMFHMIRLMFPAEERIMNGYYSWLPSPKGQAMQLDCYLPAWKLAFEHQGQQHYEFNAYMHKTRARFEWLQKCDQAKHRLCQNAGVTLVYVPYHAKLTKEGIHGRIASANPDLYAQLVERRVIR